jgi:hypothetical protein
VVLHTGLETPFFLNNVARRLCSLCDGKRTLSEILQTMAKYYPEHPRRIVMEEATRFLVLLKELKLLWLAI